jgi:hypothetical protein
MFGPHRRELAACLLVSTVAFARLSCRECASRSDVHFHARPKALRVLVVPRIHNASSHMLSYLIISFGRVVSGVADVRLGDTSSMLVALRMCWASSDSCLRSA